RANPAYLQRIDRVNIVGYGRPWRETDTVDHTIRVDRLSVLKADVYGFSTMMRSGADTPVRKALEEGGKKGGQGALITGRRGGDRIMIVHDDPVALAQMARQIMDDVYQAPGQPLLRMALHWGDVQTRQDAAETERVVAGGSAILLAARVEPHVAPGQIWATEEFRQQLVQKPSLWRGPPLPGPARDPFHPKEGGKKEP